MANHGLGESIAELQSLIGHRRLARGDQAGAVRMLRAARNTRVTEHWFTTGWNQPGMTLSWDKSRGRGWHDADRPSRLP